MVLDAGEGQRDEPGQGDTPANGEGARDLLRRGEEEGSKRGEISTATLGRMLGLATTAELRIVEGKIDALTGRIGLIGAKVERIAAGMAAAPTGADLERIDAQLAALRTMIAERIVSSPSQGGQERGGERSPSAEKIGKAKTDKVVNEEGDQNS